MARFGIEQIVHEHRIPLSTLDRDSQRPQEEDIELHILSHLRDFIVLEERSQNRGILRLYIVARSHIGIVSEWHIPRFVLLDCERKTDNAVAKHIEARSFEVEAEVRIFGNPRHDLTQIVGRKDSCILVRRSSCCSKAICEEVDLHLLDWLLRLNSRHLRYRSKQIAKERALSLQRSLLLLTGLHACHICELHLWCLLRNG